MLPIHNLQLWLLKYVVRKDVSRVIIKGDLTVSEVTVHGMETDAHVLRRPAHVNPFVAIHQQGRGPAPKGGGRWRSVIQWTVALIRLQLQPLPVPKQEEGMNVVGGGIVEK